MITIGDRYRYGKLFIDTRAGSSRCAMAMSVSSILRISDRLHNGSPSRITPSEADTTHLAY